ncbi:MAG TPA: ABC transporter permease [Sphingomicrobium sp.]|nr:ABC transporter permease [Sphingomicrobium sp.]
MLDAISAELLKLRRHKATWFLVWIYPILFAVGILILLATAASGAVPHHHQSLAEWLSATAIVWRIPASSFGRYLIAAFVAVVFAGEYGWNTWKLIIPHRSRTALVAAKYCAVAILLLIAFVLSALITIVGNWASGIVTGDAAPAGITLMGLLRVQGTAALVALAPFLVTIGYASVAAVLTRSTIAALVIALVAVTIEQLVFGLGPLASAEFPKLAAVLYDVLPGYHLGNLASWIQTGAALRTEFAGGRQVALSWPVSLAVIAAWVFALIGGTFVVFSRQDIN